MASKAKHGDRSKAVEPGTETQEQGRLPASTREDKIRRRAYELYVERGGEPGRDIEDWPSGRTRADGGQVQCSRRITKGAKESI
jgi:hypothetical protein